MKPSMRDEIIDAVVWVGGTLIGIGALITSLVSLATILSGR